MRGPAAPARATAAALAAAAVVAVAAGCSTLIGTATGEDLARDAAREGAHRVATDIDDARIRSVAAADLAYRYSDPSSSSWQRGTASDTELSAEALSWDGMTRDAGGARFVLRITATVNGGGWGRPNGTWTGCFGFRAYASSAWRDTTVDEVACPSAPPSAPPSPHPAPALPADASGRLSSLLATATAASLAGDLEVAFPDGSVRSDAVTGAHLIRDSGSEGAVLAVAVGISGTTDCQVGTRDAAGTVRVWHPQNITLRAGEAGCAIGNALHPVTTH